MTAKLKNEVEVIDSLLANHAKLNELNEPQMDTVKEVLKEGIELGLGLGAKLGEADGAIKTAELYNSITQKLILARTFMASISAMPVLYILITYFELKSVPLSLFLTALVNTTGYYLVDLLAKGLRGVAERLRKKANDSTGSSPTDTEG